MNTRKAIEAELKFASSRRIVKADVATVLERLGLRVRWLPPYRQVDTYFDTKDHALFRGGASFRVRRRGTTITGTLKVPDSNVAGLMRRQEMEWRILLDQAETWTQKEVNLSQVPSDIKTTLKEFGVRSLTPTLTIVTVRSEGDVVGTHGFLAEAALDEVTSGGARGEETHWELELELRSGDTCFLREIGEAFKVQLGLEASTQSKFSLAMARVG